MAFTYAKSGVNYSLMDAFKNACLKVSGNNSQLIKFPTYYHVDIVEGLGSLNKLVEDIYYQTGRDFYYQAGWGNAASIINDLTSLGATPKTLKLFVAAGSQNWFKEKQRWQNLIRGFKDAAKYSGASWNGGETQTLVGIVHPKSVVLAGSATGIIQPKSKLLTDQKIKVRDRIILLYSSGVHTNGITLIRKIFKHDPKVLMAACQNKIIIYAPLINKLLKDDIAIHYASHITGHGWRKIMRSKRSFTYVLEKVPQPQPIFQKIQQKTAMSNIQMYGDYNMGAGMALFAPVQEINKIFAIAEKMNITALDAGYVEQGPRRVTIRPLDIEFKGSSLQIR